MTEARNRPTNRTATGIGPGGAPSVSVVVPALNEAANLAVVLPQIPVAHQVIVVDGGSVDDTVAVVRSVRPDALLLQQTRRGKGNALAVGFAHVTGDVVVMFDADGSADADEIPLFFDALVAGADFAKGTRFSHGGGSADITSLRRSGNRGLNAVVNATFGTRFTDLCYGYNAFWSDLIPLLELPETSLPAPADGTMLWGDGFEIETVINCRFAAAGVSITEVGSVEKLRLHGDSNLRAVPDGLRVLRTIATERRRARRALAWRSVPIRASLQAGAPVDSRVTPLVRSYLRRSSGDAGYTAGPVSNVS